MLLIATTKYQKEQPVERGLLIEAQRLWVESPETISLPRNSSQQTNRKYQVDGCFKSKKF